MAQPQPSGAVPLEADAARRPARPHRQPGRGGRRGRRGALRVGPLDRWPPAKHFCA
ncbi:hypothetical protein [Geodermatophilus chilensis]|uniref:hypothetical protein n=1 Tax=Geodermatophilus chilensis TaxID=2035835 RepID=UPI0012FFEF25|nr:hypothetical protein [Geodermatophilus chilensis]